MNAAAPAGPGAASLTLVEVLHRLQAEMYAGGSVASVLALLSPEIVWHVPGTSPIAGDHRGHAEVAGYFERRRKIADATMQMDAGEAVVDGDTVAQLIAGSALIDGEKVAWRTVGAYRIEAGLVAEVWLVPFDLALFDRVWSRRAGRSKNRPAS